MISKDLSHERLATAQVSKTTQPHAEYYGQNATSFTPPRLPFKSYNLIYLISNILSRICFALSQSLCSRQCRTVRTSLSQTFFLNNHGLIDIEVSWYRSTCCIRSQPTICDWFLSSLSCLYFLVPFPPTSYEGGILQVLLSCWYIPKGRGMPDALEYFRVLP